MPGTAFAGVDPAAVAASFGDLPTLAPVAVDLLRLADDDRASLEDIAEVIGRDPALAGQLLRVANSAVYRTGEPTASLTRAASILGLRTVRLLSLTFSVVTRPSRSDAAAMLVWRHTLAASAMARQIAATHEPRLVDECFVVALLGNVGRVALAGLPAYAEGARSAPGLLGPDDERDLVGFTSDDVTSHVLDGWKLPAVLGEAVRHRHDPGAAHGIAARIARVLNVADAAARLVIAGSDQAGPALERYRDAARTHLALSEYEADGLVLAAAPALEDLGAMFRADPPNDLPLDLLLARAKGALARLSLALVAAFSQEQSLLMAENQLLAAQACTDSLTALPNRRAYDTFIEQAVAARLRREVPGALGLLMVDLDRFKSVNDAHGHGVGDDVLRLVGARLAMQTRRDEFTARIGGEEFVVVLPVTNPEELAAVAERVRRAVADEQLDHAAGPIRMTASVGGAWLEDTEPFAAERLYDAADAALNEAKRAGRDRAVVVRVQPGAR